MQKKVNNKIAYKKPAILAATKNASSFSAGCATKSGYMCIACRCS